MKILLPSGAARVSDATDRQYYMKSCAEVVMTEEALFQGLEGKKNLKRRLYWN
jgi:hypothetical protein